MGKYKAVILLQSAASLHQRARFRLIGAKQARSRNECHPPSLRCRHRQSSILATPLRTCLRQSGRDFIASRSSLAQQFGWLVLLGCELDAKHGAYCVQANRNRNRTRTRQRKTALSS